MLALPVLILVWAGVHYMGEMVGGQLEAESEARMCAWLMSAGACQVEIEGCETAVGSGRSPRKTDKLTAAGERATAGSTLAGAVGKPLMDQLKGLFGLRGYAEAGAEIERPALLGGKTASVGAAYSLPCNTQKANVEGLAQDVIERVP